MRNRLVPLPLLLWLCGCQFPGATSKPSAQSGPEDLTADGTPVVDLRAAEPLAGFLVQDAYGTPLAAPRLTQPSKDQSNFTPHVVAALPHPGDMLALDFHAATPTQPQHDWRPYSALQFRISAFPETARLEVGLESEAGGAITWQPVNTPRQTARVRVELLDLGGGLDLSSIRRILWRPVAAPPDFSFELDDIVLLDQTRWLTPPAPSAGDLFVQQRGRRLIVGVAGRFTLEFRHGQIVRWTQDGGRNLTVENGLGPWPIPLADDWWMQREAAAALDNPKLFADWGTRVLTRQECVEASAFRAVIRGEWRYRGEQNVAAADEPFHTWQYTIYPDGEIFLGLHSQAPPSGWPAARVGFAVTLDDRVGFRRLPFEPQPGRRQPRFVALSRPEPGQCDLLWTPHDAGIANQLVESASSDGAQMAVTVGDMAARPQMETAHLLRIWPPDIDGLTEARALAGDYQEPPTLKTTRGSLRTDIPGDLNHDGFNECEGCWEVALDADALTCRLDPGLWPRSGAIVRVHGTTGRSCWAYQDGRLVNSQGRDHAGELLVRLGRFGNAPTALELTVKH